MPVTRRGSASTTGQPETNASPPRQTRPSHRKAQHQGSGHCPPSGPQKYTSAKRKASPLTTPSIEHVISTPSKADRKQLKLANGHQPHRSPPSKRHKACTAGEQYAENALQATETEVPLKTCSIGTIMPGLCHINEPQGPFQSPLKACSISTNVPVVCHINESSGPFQSPSRPPLVPRTPATADRAGRNQGVQSSLLTDAPALPG